MNLQNWEQKGWVERHKSSPQEIEELFQVADRDLKDCHARELSDDWRLNIAYNAALQSAKAALAAAGYRASREAHHFRVIQSLFRASIESRYKNDGGNLPESGSSKGFF